MEVHVFREEPTPPPPGKVKHVTLVLTPQELLALQDMLVVAWTNNHLTGTALFVNKDIQAINVL